MTPAETGRPAYHPATMLKIYLYGYLNRVQSSRWLEREAQRNVELMWLTGRLAPDFKTIASFRQANGASIRAVCSQFIVLCRQPVAPVEILPIERAPLEQQWLTRHRNDLSLALPLCGSLDERIFTFGVIAIISSPEGDNL
jgi:hypothetical protein